MNTSLLEILCNETTKIDWIAGQDFKDEIKNGYYILSDRLPRDFFEGVERMMDDSERFKLGCKYSLDYFTSDSMYIGNEVILITVWDAIQVESDGARGVASNCILHIDMAMGTLARNVFFITYNKGERTVRKKLFEVDLLGNLTSDFELKDSVTGGKYFNWTLSDLIKMGENF